ncbi:hypothetical protein VTG60DRAFT_7391 [Thermothelomyces hinnuleus]
MDATTRSDSSPVTLDAHVRTALQRLHQGGWHLRQLEWDELGEVIPGIVADTQQLFPDVSSDRVQELIPNAARGCATVAQPSTAPVLSAPTQPGFVDPGPSDVRRPQSKFLNYGWQLFDHEPRLATDYKLAKGDTKPRGMSDSSCF